MWRNSRQFGKRIVFALVPTVVFWCLLEVVLASIGFQPVDTLRDPIVEFEGLESLFVKSDSNGTAMVSRTSKLSLFNDQMFSVPKPSGVRRVFCLGGSTTYGRPYDNTSSFAGWMGELLSQATSAGDWEVINAGGISYASYRVAAVMEEVLKYDPDLIVIYSANNEYLERRTYAGLTRRSPWLRRMQGLAARTRTYAAISHFKRSGGRGRRRGQHAAETLPGEVSERLNKTIGPQDYKRSEVFSPDVLNDYEFNLERMIGLARQKGVPVILVAPAINVRNMSPFKSQFSDDTDVEVQSRVREMLAQVESLVDGGRIDEAVGFAEQAVALDGSYADSHYLLGQALFAAKNYQAADRALRQAADEDVCPLRATGQVVQTLKSVAIKYDVPLVDFDAILRGRSTAEHGHAVLGEEYFLDHVHPTIDANGYLGLAIVEAMSQLGAWNIDSSEVASLFETAREQITSRTDTRANGVALRNLAKVLHWAGKFQEAIRPADDAIELLGGDANARLVLADCLHQTEQDDSARNQYEILMSDSPELLPAYLPYATFLIDTSQSADDDDLLIAETLLLTAGVARPNEPHIAFQLARLYGMQQKLSDARESLALAEKTIVDDPVLADSIRELGKQLDAAEK